jgi:DNA-binding NarL/FixJ family response regulator
MGLRVVVQERQRFFREGLSMVLNAEPDLDVVGTAEIPGELAEICVRFKPDVVLLELDADWDGCRLAAALRKRHRALRVIGLAGEIDLTLSKRAYQAGIRSIVPRSGGIPAVLQAVRPSRGSKQRVVPMEPPPLKKERASRALTPRELDVLRLVGSGHTTREVSERLGISPKTVENHKQRMFAKLGVQNQAHAVAVAMRSGILSSGIALDGSGPA